jgi:hypothetical protein
VLFSHVPALVLQAVGLTEFSIGSLQYQVVENTTEPLQQTLPQTFALAHHHGLRTASSVI